MCLWSKIQVKNFFKVEKILKGSLDSITFTFSENSNYGQENLLCICKGKTLLGVVNKRLKIKILLTIPCNVLPLLPKPRPHFEFSLKMKVMGLNAGYLLKSFLFLPSLAVDQENKNTNIFFTLGFLLMQILWNKWHNHVLNPKCPLPSFCLVTL